MLPIFSVNFVAAHFMASWTTRTRKLVFRDQEPAGEFVFWVKFIFNHSKVEHLFTLVTHGITPPLSAEIHMSNLCRNLLRRRVLVFFFVQMQVFIAQWVRPLSISRSRVMPLTVRCQICSCTRDTRQDTCRKKRFCIERSRSRVFLIPDCISFTKASFIQ